MVSSSSFIQTVRQFMDIAMHQSMRERAHFAKATGLSMPQFGILMQLHYHSNCGVSDISERFDITSAAATGLYRRRQLWRRVDQGTLGLPFSMEIPF